MSLECGKVYRGRGESYGVARDADADTAVSIAVRRAYEGLMDSVRSFLATKQCPAGCPNLFWRWKPREPNEAPLENVQIVKLWQSPAVAIPAPVLAGAAANVAAQPTCLARLPWEIDYWCDPDVEVTLGDLLKQLNP